MKTKPKRIDPCETEYKNYYDNLKARAKANKHSKILCMQVASCHGFCFKG